MRELQRRVLVGLGEQLLSPESGALLVKEYHRERTRRLGSERQDKRARRRRLAELDSAIAGLVAAIADGGVGFAEIRAALPTKTAEREQLRAAMAETESTPVIALHPRIGDAYRLRVAELIDGLHQGAITDYSSAGQIRALVGAIRIAPAEPKGCAIEVACSLAAVVALATTGEAKRGTDCERW